MNQKTWLVQRAVLAVVLMVSFYALARVEMGIDGLAFAPVAKVK